MWRAPHPDPATCVVLLHMKGAFNTSRAGEGPDGRCAGIASKQYGLISRQQALQAGVSIDSIKHRLATARWERVLPRVYAIAGSARSWRRALLAACIWAGQLSVVSHRAAGCFWGFDGFDDHIVEISTIAGVRTRPGIVVHHVEDFGRADVTVVEGIPITSPLRTVFDLCSVTDKDRAEYALEDALRRRMTSIQRCNALLDRLGGHGVPGTAAFRQLMKARGPGYVPTASVLEVCMTRILVKCKLGTPVRQYPVVRRSGRMAYIDFAFAAIKLGIEVDGYESHARRDRWQYDMHRENDLKALGWTILHFSWEDVQHRPDMVISQIKRALHGELSGFSCT